MMVVAGNVVLGILLGGSASIFINIPAFVLVVGVGMGLQLATVGGAAFFESIRAVRILAIELPPEVIRPGLSGDLRGFARHLYAASALGALIGFIQMLASMDDFSTLHFALGVVLLAPFYATLLAECVLRPCANRVDYLLGPEESAVQRGETGEA